LLDCARLPKLLKGLAEDDDVFTRPCYIEIECSDRNIHAECQEFFVHPRDASRSVGNIRRFTSSERFFPAAGMPDVGTLVTEEWWEDAAPAKICNIK